jgi:hypothetical protein
MVLARPLKPSMILMALATPPTVKAVKMTDTTVKPSSQSSPQTLTWVMAWPVMAQASRPEAMVANNRCITPTRLVTSSTKPNTKAGMAAIKMG